MHEATIEIATADGTCSAVVFRHDEPRPGVLHLTDIGGIRPAHLDRARQLAERGFCVLVPNVFYRTGEPPIWDFPRVMGEPKTMQRMAELAGPLSGEAMRRDAGAYVDALLADEGTSGDGVGVVGHCITGQMAVFAAAARPDVVRAAASVHGGFLVRDAPDADSAHRALRQVRARLYFAHAEADASMTAEQIATLEGALADWGGRYDSETLPARHGWTASDGAVHDPAQAEHVLDRLTALMRTIG